MLVELIERNCVIEGATFKADNLGRIKVVKSTIPAKVRGTRLFREYSVGGAFHDKAKQILL